MLFRHINVVLYLRASTNFCPLFVYLLNPFGNILFKISPRITIKEF